jgi:hypothetical protein
VVIFLYIINSIYIKIKIMDILNWLSWKKAGRIVSSVTSKGLLPIGEPDPTRDDKYLTVGITVEDFVRSLRTIITIDAPTVIGETVDLTLSAPETVVKFVGDITQDFNLNTIPVGSKIGDKLYLIITGASTGNPVITSTGALDFNGCGPDTSPSNHDVDAGTTIIPLVFDGEKFYGLDYC